MAGMAETLEDGIKRGLVPPSVSVMPSAGRSFYMNYRDGSQKWETFIVEDLLAWMRKGYNVPKGREGTLITGISMGGMGSLPGVIVAAPSLGVKTLKELIAAANARPVVRAVDDVSFAVAAGQKYAVLGSNGAGKTTLFNAITGDFPPTAGRIRFFGPDGERETSKFGLALTLPPGTYPL